MYGFIGQEEEDPAEVYAALSQPIDVDCLLPTGVLVPLRCRPDGTLQKIKSRLWHEAQKYPLFNQLKPESCYVFVGVNTSAEREEFVDEKKRFCDLNLFHPLLKVQERIGDQEEKLLNAEIGNLIGKRLHEFDVLGAEVQDFRHGIQSYCEGIVQNRNAEQSELLFWAYPPDLEASPELGRSLQSKLQNGGFAVEVVLPGGGTSPPLRAEPQWTIEDLLQEIQKQVSVYSRESSYDLCVKVCGSSDYMLDRTAPLSQYRYFRKCIARGVEARIVLHRKSNLLSTALQGQQGYQMPITLRARNPSPPSDNAVSLWQVTSNLKVFAVKATNVNAESILLRSGVYHGGEPLSDIRSTKLKSVSGNEAIIQDVLAFDLPHRDLPRSSRLCFVIYGTSSGDTASGKKAKSSGLFSGRKREHVPLAWVNINLFDYNGKMRTGTQELNCWLVDGALDDTLNFIGTTVENPDKESALVLHIELERHQQPIVYPSFSEMPPELPILPKPMPPNVTQQLMKIIELDPLAELEDQDLELVWNHRSQLAAYPHSLPKLLKAVKWNNREHVSRMLVLLQSWKKIKPEAALELLDYQYAEQSVRMYAVSSLSDFTDNQLLHFLLQLTQVLKYESYLDCPLGKFLLARALRNQKIGHYLFWNLRAEMHDPAVAVRFGLLLEAYCRGAISHMRTLAVQVEALNRLRAVSEVLQSKTLKERPKGMRKMRETLESPAYVEALSNLVDPLHPQFHFACVKLDKCKFMDSKMKPLWMVYENADPEGADVYQIYKNGDDLRQDMLTLQIIGIMDSIWQADGLDMRMIPYGCLSTGNQVGLIEVVLQANTVAKIQKEMGGGSRGAFDKSTLYRWLAEKNKDKQALERALEAFTYSCAGYCVATYVLGIGDRHSDNIMLKETGQLFHIDFGHFLGNFKSKFGVKRERVPFVLTDDFIYVVTHGKDDAAKVDKFRRLCEEAFLLLRKKGSLLINLFAMMLSTGIPELRSLDDINYVRDALVLGASDEEALQSFRKKFSEAQKNSWSVSWNWYIHNVVRS
ncbi:phosphatidylinositol 4,5-bisphosphate 3-kinase catalytic subunit beta isoform-like [Sycon ciliatum]|uniref:phosphatidylinositol 4,5-bisphosphate 3-kinase catalytic subunit beta isoform-like n=1 Tax=Sycon ciliatum TaxID=27933 RepID=UPI0020AB4B7E|eukprot:scpid27567/ scgid6689/ Phosphatidylinositol 4,5-bisphosphate 3-kinase catalytic subunit beta isoform; Phosphatidylinositol 4,5-bisphosphate 3-kinase 110 kDa catalytic subunit beta